VIPVLPVAPVERIHVRPLAGDHGERVAAADDLAIAGEVCLHAKVRLRTTRVAAETGDDLVEDVHGAGAVREPPELVQEVTRLEVRAAALHRLDHDGGELVAACTSA